MIIHSILRIKGGARERRRKIRQLILSCRILSGADFAPTPWCRWPDSNRHALRHLILSYLLHTEHRRTQPPVEVVAGHLKALQILLFLKLVCRKAPFRLPFSLFSIWTEFLDFGGTSEGCYPQTEHNSTRSRFINHKYIIAYFSAIDNILSEKEVSL